MARRLIPPVSTLALLGVLAFVSIGLANVLQRRIDISPLESRAGDSRSAVLDNRALPAWDAPDPRSLTAIVTAPLFVEGRVMPGDVVTEVIPEPVVEEPQPIAEPVAAPPPPPPLNYGLVGVMITGGQKKALMAHASTGAQVWVGLSDQLASWSVTEITSDRVVLTNKDTIRQLVLYPR